MQVRRKIFPYPVVNNSSFLSNYPDTYFELLFDEVKTENTIELKNIRFNTNSKFINDLFDNNIIRVKCIIECSSTIYRKSFDLSPVDDNTIILYKSDLADKVEISMFAYVTEDFIIESSNEFDEDYQGINYEIDKYSIIAINDGYSVNIVHTSKEDDLKKSIFSVIPIVDSDSKTFEVDVKTNKIEISMSYDLYMKYLVVSDDESLAFEFFCILLIPVLIEALNSCKKLISDGGDLDDVISKYNWFNSICKSYYAVYGNELTEEEFMKISLVSLSQKLLGSPLESALDSISDKKIELRGDENYGTN